MVYSIISVSTCVVSRQLDGFGPARIITLSLFAQLEACSRYLPTSSLLDGAGAGRLLGRAPASSAISFPLQRRIEKSSSKIPILAEYQHSYG